MNKTALKWRVALGIIMLGATPFSITPIKSAQATTGSGLVQLWQEIPEGQRKPKNVSESKLREMLYCKVNHDLVAGQGINEFDTYINSCYVDDAYYLDETNESYKILVSGYEGWVKKSESKQVTLKFYVDKNEREVPTSKEGEWKTYTYTVNTVANLIPYSADEDYALPSGIEHSSTDEYVKTADDFEEDASLFNRLGEWLGVKKMSTKVVQSPSFYANEKGALIHYISKDITKEGNYSSVVIGKAPTWMKEGKAYFSYDGIYFYDKLSEIDVFGEGAINQDEPFFNYYQYVPIRSISNVTAHDMDYYLRQKGYTEKATSYPAKIYQSQLYDEGESFRNAQANYHINGALQFSMAIHESAWGRSSLSIKKNNLFGMNAIDSNPTEGATTFKSPAHAIDYHAERYLSWGYSDPIGDSRYYGFYLGNKSGGMNVKYASDPFWGEKIAGHYYNLDKVSGFRDFNTTSFGVIMYEAGIPIYKEPTVASQVLYYTKNGKTDTRLSYYPVVITGETGDFYEVLLDTPIGANGAPVYNLAYTGTKEVGYIEKDVIHYRNKGESTGTPTKVESTYRPLDKGNSLGSNQSTSETVVNGGNSYVTSGSGVSAEGKECIGQGKILLDALSVRSEPSARGKVLGRLPKNEIIDVLGQEGKWIMFDFQGETAYVSEAYVQLEQATTQQGQSTENITEPVEVSSNLNHRTTSGNKKVIDIGYVAVEALNVRSEASISANEIGAVYKGDKVEIVGQKGPFYEINFKTGTGYVSSQYISMNPIIEEGEDESDKDTSRPEEGMGTPTVVIKIGYVASNGIRLNVYESMTDSSSLKIIGTLKEGTEVEILRDEGSMYMIKYKDGIGYVEKNYISNSKPTGTTNSGSGNSSTNSNNNSNASNNDNNSTNSSTNNSNNSNNVESNNSSNSNNSNNLNNSNNSNNTDSNQSGNGSSSINEWFSNQSNVGSNSTPDDEEIILPNLEGYVFESRNDLGKVKYDFVKAKLEDGVLYLIGRVNPEVEGILYDKDVKKNFLIVDTASKGIIKRVELKYQAATELLTEGNDVAKFELGFPLQKLPNGVYDLKMLLDKDGQQTTTDIYEKSLVGYKIIFEGRIYQVQETVSSEGVKTMQLAVMNYIEEESELNENIKDELSQEGENVEEITEEDEGSQQEESGSLFSNLMDGVKKFFLNIGKTILGWFGLDDKEEIQNMDNLQTVESEERHEAGESAEEQPDNLFEITTDESSSGTLTNEE